MKRGLYVSPFFLISIGLALQAIHSDSLLFGFMLGSYSITIFFLGIAVNVPFFQNIFMEQFGHLFPRIEGERPHFPAYSAGETLVARQKYDQAIEKYRQIAADFPEEKKPWLEMLTVALKFKRDPHLGEKIMTEASRRFPEPEDREVLISNYKALKDYFLAGNREPKKKTLAFNGPKSRPVDTPSDNFEKRTGTQPAPAPPEPSSRKKIAFRKKNGGESELLPIDQKNASAPEKLKSPALSSRPKLPFDQGKQTQKPVAEQDDHDTGKPAATPPLPRKKIAFPRRPEHSSDQRPVTSDQRPVTSDQRPVTSDQRPATSDQ